MQAVVYFQRALKQDRRFLNAWTLMGHEYVEMKNPPAAIGESPSTGSASKLSSQRKPRHAAREETSGTCKIERCERCPSESRPDCPALSCDEDLARNSTLCPHPSGALEMMWTDPKEGHPPLQTRTGERRTSTPVTIARGTAWARHTSCFKCRSTLCTTLGAPRS